LILLGIEIPHHSFAIERGGRRQRISTKITKSVKPTLKSGGEITVGIREDCMVMSAAPMSVDGDSESIPELQLQGSSFVLPNITAIKTVHRRKREKSKSGFQGKRE
jgi:hypothetical protein